MYNLVVDLGNFKISICKKDLGVVLQEHALVAVSARDKQVVEVGTAAKQLLQQRQPASDIQVVKGDTSQRKMLSFLLQHFFQQLPKTIFKKNWMLFCTPTCLTAKEKTEHKNLAYSLNVSKVKLVPAAVFSYVDACFQSAVHTKLIIDIGSATTEVSLVYDTKILAGCTIGLGGNDFDRLIKNIVLEHYSLSISDAQAEQLKRDLATLLPNDIITANVAGRHSTTGKEVEQQLSSELFRHSFELLFQEIIQPINTFKQALAPDIINELQSGGVYVCGGMANFTGLDRYIKSKLMLPVIIPPFPEDCVMRGAEIVLGSKKVLDKILSNIL